MNKGNEVRYTGSFKMLMDYLKALKMLEGWK